MTALALLVGCAGEQAADERQDPAPEVARDYSYRTARDARGEPVDLWLTVYEPTGEHRRRGALVFLHGGGFRAGSRVDFSEAAAFAAADGWLAVTIDYRLRRFAEGDLQQTILAARDALADSFLALDWIRARSEQFAIDSDRIVVFGESAGGFLAAALAWLDDPNGPEQTQHPLAAVSASGLFVPYFIGEVNPGDSPVLFYTWTRDPADDLTSQRQTCIGAVSRGVGCELRVLDGNEHGIDFVEHYDEIVDFLSTASS